MTRNNWLGISPSGGTRADTAQMKVATPFSILALPLQTAQDAYTSVLNQAGCVLPARDVLDQRIISDVRNRTGGLVDVQGGFPHGTPYTTSQVAWPVLSCGAAPIDNDHDGMPDTYETANGLNPNNPADRQTIAANGYTNLENYLNGITSVLLGSKTAEAAEKAGLGVYPNPGREQCTLMHPFASQAVTVEIYTFDGRRVRSATALPGTTQPLLPLTGLAHGNYLIRYQGADGPLTVKLLHD